MPKLSFAGLHVAQRAPMAAWKAALLRVAAVLLALVMLINLLAGRLAASVTKGRQA